MTTSEQINEIASALAMAQGMMGVARKDSENPYFHSKYADLASVWDACRGPLSKNGLAIVQSPSAEGLRVMVDTLLTHTSGQWMRGQVSATAKDESPQSVGSAITYLRRYALQSFAAVAPEEDDAEAAQGRRHAEEPSAVVPVVRGRSTGPTPSPAAPPAAEDATGTALVKAVEVKSGSKNGKPWTRYSVTFSDGTVASTFDKKLGQLAKDAEAGRLPVVWVCMQGAKGNDLQALMLAHQKEPKEPQQPDEPVDGPEKALTGRVMTMADGQKAWVLQTSKRQMYTEDEQLAQGFKVARSDGLGIVPTLKGSWTSPDGTVMARLVKLVVWHPPSEVTNQALAESLAETLAELRQPVEEFTREPGDDD